MGQQASTGQQRRHPHHRHHFTTDTIVILTSLVVIAPDTSSSSSSSSSDLFTHFWPSTLSGTRPDPGCASRQAQQQQCCWLPKAAPPARSTGLSGQVKPRRRLPQPSSSSSPLDPIVVIVRRLTPSGRRHYHSLTSGSPRPTVVVVVAWPYLGPTHQPSSLSPARPAGRAQQQARQQQQQVASHSHRSAAAPSSSGANKQEHRLLPGARSGQATLGRPVRPGQASQPCRPPALSSSGRATQARPSTAPASQPAPGPDASARSSARPQARQTRTAADNRQSFAGFAGFASCYQTAISAIIYFYLFGCQQTTIALWPGVQRQQPDQQQTAPDIWLQALCQALSSFFCYFIAGRRPGQALTGQGVARSHPSQHARRQAQTLPRPQQATTHRRPG